MPGHTKWSDIKRSRGLGKMSVGVGITTRNRPFTLKAGLANFARYHTNESVYVIVDDASDTEENEALVDEFRQRVPAKVIYRRSADRLGIARAKNACLGALEDTSHVFLFDDDCWPRQSGWSTHWIRACEVNQVHHSTYQTWLGEHGTSNGAIFHATETRLENGYSVDGWNNCMGVALFFTREALNQLGGYDHHRASNVYGYEHANMSQRALRLGLTAGLSYPCPSDLRQWVYALDIDYHWHNEVCDHDMPPLEVVATSVTPEEAAGHTENAQMMDISDRDAFVPLSDPLPKSVGVDVVVATKCNDHNLLQLISTLHRDPAVGRIVVIADGEETYSRLNGALTDPHTLLQVPLSAGLHIMWNMGMDAVNANGRHVAIVNDDIELSTDTMSIVASLLNEDRTLGLVSPSDNLEFTGRLDTTTGFAGFCMVIAHDLAREWRFDERMMWWYGDNDVISWVAKTKDRVAGLTGLTHAIGNKSHTINTSPPPNFHKDIQNDAALYRQKWS